MQNNCFESEITVAWLKNGHTRRNGSHTILRRKLSDVLSEAASSDPFHGPKHATPAMFPYSPSEPECPYDDDAVDRVTLSGGCLFFDIDDKPLFEKIWDARYDIRKAVPSLAAMWFSMNGKGHLAFRCAWRRNSGYKARWYAMESDLRTAIESVLGKESAKVFGSPKVNDRHMSTALDYFSIGYTSGYELWDAETYSLDVDESAYSYADIPSSTVEKHSLFVNPEIKRKWIESPDVESFVKWCDRKLAYVHVTESMTPPYDSEMEIDGETCRYWVNDGSYYRLPLCYAKTGFKLADRKKGAVRSASVFYARVMGMDFDEALYNTSKYYCGNMNRFGYADDREKDVITDALEYVFANMDRMNASFLRDARPVIVSPVIFEDPDWVYYGTRHNERTGRERARIAAAIKRRLREEKFAELCRPDDTPESAAEKMAEYYPRITPPVAAKIAKACGIRLRRAENRAEEPGENRAGKYEYGDRYRGRYDYVNAYDRSGKRVKVKRALVDNITYFAGKKDWKNCKSK